MLLIYTVYLLLSSLVVYLMFYSTLNKFIKAIALTVIVLLGLITQDHYISNLGKPINAYPVGEFVYVFHVPQGDDISVWVWTEEDGNKLHTIPYSQEAAEKLQNAKEKSEAGQAQKGEFTEGDSKHAAGLTMDKWQGPKTEETK